VLPPGLNIVTVAVAAISANHLTAIGVEPDGLCPAAGGNHTRNTGRSKSGDRKAAVGRKADGRVIGRQIEVRRHAGQFNVRARPESVEIELDKRPRLGA